MTFPYIHDLDELLQRLERSGLKVPQYVRQADELSPFAVVMRYPGFAAPITKQRYRRFVRIAERVVDWAERRIARRR
ncbi:MAG TPA: HEPN domain-containing protein [Pirellulales bacterium]|nr:HEPN domain-containing protein [Pirellulales bacterium]